MIDNSIFCTTVLFVGICFPTNVVLYPTITLLPSDVPFNMDDFSPIQTSSPIITGAVLGFSYSAPKFGNFSRVNFLLFSARIDAVCICIPNPKIIRKHTITGFHCRYLYLYIVRCE